MSDVKAKSGTNTTSNPVITIRNGSKTFGPESILSGIELSISSGDFVTFLGPSGSGKTTLLRLLSGLDSWTTGEMEISKSLRTSFVFQEPNLLSWRTVFENVQLPLELHHQHSMVTESPSARADRVQQALQQVGLEKDHKKRPHELSGGMKMRVSIARALITQPHILFMDEPFAALDEPTREELQEQLWKLKLQNQTTVLFVTHSLSEATFLSQHVYFLRSFKDRLDPQSKTSSIASHYTVRLSTPRDSTTRSTSGFFEELNAIRSQFHKLKVNP